MEEITNIALEALRRYYDSLSKFGYKKYNEVEKIIILLFLEELLSYNYFGFVTEEDYEVIIKSLYCISNDTCLIDFPSYASYDSLIRDYDSNLILRAAEDNTIRVSENGCFREKV